MVAHSRLYWDPPSSGLYNADKAFVHKIDKLLYIRFVQSFCDMFNLFFIIYPKVDYVYKHLFFF